MRLPLSKHNVPQSLIAQYPCEERANAKLMVLHRDSGKIEHKRFYNILDYLNPGDIVVANDSYMMNNILYGRIGDAGIEVKVSLLRRMDCEDIVWEVQVDPSRKIRKGNKISFPGLGIYAEVVDNTFICGRILHFETEEEGEILTEQGFLKIINDSADVDLPDFIKRPIQKEDKQWVKSIYAKHFGSMTHVTAGLHFDQNLLLKLALKDVKFETLTYKIMDFPENKFDSKTVSEGKGVPEFCKISDELISKINYTKEHSYKVCSVGYSTTLGIENLFSPALNKLTKPKINNNEEIMVTKTLVSSADFRVCDMILTNFHENGSTFLISDTAFCGRDLLKKVYEEAVKNKYKFYMYGDSLLII